MVEMSWWVTGVSLLSLFNVGWSNSYDVIPLDEVSLNRVGNMMTSAALDDVPHAKFGFTWEDGDASTLKWRPQGMTTTVSTSNKEYVAVSWYGRSQEDYSDRGARISIVNIQESLDSNSSSVQYRHVLLVDENYNTFEGIHAGGLACAGDNYIHVPDSRSGTKKVYTFSTTNIRYIPSSDRSAFYDYAYVMPRVGSYDVPITPSFMSYDFSRSQFLVGTFYQCSSYHEDTSECLNEPHDTFTWYSAGTATSTTPSCQPFFSEMQGAQSATMADEYVLWSSSSYGSSHESHLHIATLPDDKCDSSSNVSKTFRTVVYPPGLEDLHRSSASSPYADYVWSLTEFGSNDGSGNTRRVFAMNIEDLMP
mmetsp:Transcript_26396/g.49518  ORF Transcript_26396/g.49518 Transcript_26396/m.49518 type:complete len:364 (+) Transcript_26396:40-1131(+)